MGENEIAGPPLDVRRMLNALNDHHVDYVVVGGIAALIHGATRATKDADIVVDGRSRNLQNLLQALSALRARARTETESVDYDNAGNAAASVLDFRGDLEPVEDHLWRQVGVEEQESGRECSRPSGSLIAARFRGPNVFPAELISKIHLFESKAIIWS